MSDKFGAVRIFEMKLKLFRKQLENVNPCHFSSCYLLPMDGSVSVPFPVEMFYSLARNFKMRLDDIRRQATNIRIFETHSALKSLIPQKNCNLN
jgi:hypothetical protein